MRGSQTPANWWASAGALGCSEVWGDWGEAPVAMSLSRSPTHVRAKLITSSNNTELVKDLAAAGFGERAAAIVDALEKIIDARIEMKGRR